MSFLLVAAVFMIKVLIFKTFILGYWFNSSILLGMMMMLFLNNDLGIVKIILASKNAFY